MKLLRTGKWVFFFIYSSTSSDRALNVKFAVVGLRSSVPIAIHIEHFRKKYYTPSLYSCRVHNVQAVSLDVYNVHYKQLNERFHQMRGYVSGLTQTNCRSSSFQSNTPTHLFRNYSIRSTTLPFRHRRSS